MPIDLETVVYELDAGLMLPVWALFAAHHGHRHHAI
jgi:hypothetical protein